MKNARKFYLTYSNRISETMFSFLLFKKVKQPTVLEFLELEEKAKYVESDLETAIINKLQKFLLELDKGYLFETRQKRFTLNEDNYYVDLVSIIDFCGAMCRQT